MSVHRVTKIEKVTGNAEIITKTFFDENLIRSVFPDYDGKLMRITEMNGTIPIAHTIIEKVPLEVLEIEQLKMRKHGNELPF